MDFPQHQMLPLLSLDVGPADFDYGVFLQDDEVEEYLAAESPASNPSSHTLSTTPPQGLFNMSTPSGEASTTALTPITTTNPSDSGGASSSGNSPPKSRLERRGHTKSRRGCFNCKRRRIKCQENRPACGHCVKTGLKCEYPQAPQVVHQPQHQIPLFSLQDMRFFQHFLMECSPHQPIGNHSIWTHEVPCLSQNHEYLMHAVLGLAASDLMRHDPSLVTAAMSHRLKAIKAVKKALADIPKSTDTFSDQGNALMATCYALTFQSVMLADGMSEYMCFVRGIIIVALNMYIKGAKFIFHDFIGEDQMDLLRPHMEKLPLLNRAWVDAATQSLRGLEPLCFGDSTAQTYYRLILDIAEELYVSSMGAYKAISKHYGWWMQIPHEKFRAVVDPESQVFLLLAAHWISLKKIMTMITEVEVKVSKPMQRSRDGDMDSGILRWLKYTNRQIRPEYMDYNRFPVWVEAQLDRDPTFFGKTI